MYKSLLRYVLNNVTLTYNSLIVSLALTLSALSGNRKRSEDFPRILFSLVSLRSVGIIFKTPICYGTHIFLVR